MEVEKVGIVITTFNRPEELRICLEAVMPQAKALVPEALVVVVDDGSKVDNIQVADTVDYYYWQEDNNYRLATARNIGARVAVSDGATILIFFKTQTGVRI